MPSVSALKASYRVNSQPAAVDAAAAGDVGVGSALHHRQAEVALENATAC
jgi:hypothetical protein